MANSKKLEVVSVDGRACSICGTYKPAQEFPRSRQTKTGLHPQCKACRAAKRKADPDAKAKDRESYLRNRERRRLAARERYATDSGPAKAASLKHYHAGQGRDAYLQRCFGISVDDYQAMHEAQAGLCAICGLPESRVDGRSGRVHRLAVDHDHASGTVRGLLCRKCNTAIGLLGDTASGLRRALNYLEGGRS